MVNDDPKQSHNDSGDLSKTQVIEDFETLETGTLLAGRFQVEKLQGVGRFGAVYKVKDLQLDVLVALKVLHPTISKNQQALADFKKEILLLRQLSHPNIVRVHEYYSDRELHFFTMDWIEGESLEQKLRQQNKKGESFTEQQIESYLNQTISALSFAENHKIHHRDIKPENLLIDNNDQLYLADFGLAVLSDARSEGIISGTPYYLPPEYLQKNDVHSSIDIYAVGVIFYQMLCGRLPFDANTLDALVKQKLQGVDSFPVTNKELKKFKPVILKLISAYTHSRFQTAEDLQQAVDHLLIKQPPKSKSAKQFAWIAVAILLILAVLFWWRYQTQNPPSAPHTSLAILPFESQIGGQSVDDWVRYGIPDYLNYQLAQNSELRLVNNERVLQTLDLLGYQEAPNDNQLLLLADLLKVNKMINAKLIPTGSEQSTLVLELLSVSGNTISRSTVSEIVLLEDSADSNVRQLVTDLNQALRITLDVSEETSEGFILQSGVQELIKQGQWQQAATALNDLIIKQPDSEHLWFELGQVYLNSGDLQQAEEAFAKSQSLSPPQSFIHLRATAILNELAEKFDQAEQVYSDLIDQYPLNIELKFSLAELYINTQQFPKAEQTLQQVVQLDPNHPSAWFELAKVSIWSGDAQTAVDDYLVKALVIAKKLKDIKFEGDVLNAMGVAYQRLGNLELAQDYYLQGLHKRRLANDQNGMATSMSNLATVHSIQGQHDEATEYLEQSLAVYESLNDIEGEANAYNELGVLAEEQGLYETALENYRQALTLRINLGDEWLKAESMNNIGFIYYLLSNPENALVFWQQAEQSYQKVQDPVGVIRVRENLGQMELAMGNWRSAYFIFEKALEDSKQLGLLEETLVAEAYLAKLSFLQGNFAQSLPKLESLYQQVQERNDIRGVIEFGLWLADWHSLTGNPDSLQQQLESISDLVIDKGSIEQQFYYKTLALRSDEVPDSEQYLVDMFDRTNIPDATKLRYLLDQAQRSLKSNTEDFPELARKIRLYDMALHQYEHMYLLELEGAYFYVNNEWEQLELSLNQADQLMRRMGDYWRSFQLNRLRALLVEQSGESPKLYRQRAQQQLNHLLQQLPEDSRSVFIEQQNIVAFDDNLMELGVNDE
ncbi:protein kinase domain-containing protein [Kangiella sp. M94]